MSLYILITSTIIQFLAAILALIYFSKKAHRTPWLLISGGLFMMGVRRSVSLVQALSLESMSIDPVAESVALLISILMLGGVWGLDSFFEYLEDTNQKAADELKTRKETMKKLEEANEQKQTLIREIHHRVKNNLFTVISLLEIQKSKSNQEELKKSLQLSINRIHSMALIHKEIYGLDSYTKIELSRYLKHLIGSLKESTIPLDQKIEIQYNLTEQALNLDRIIPVALVVNELVTNAFTHGFSGLEEGILKVELKTENDRIKLVIANNGHRLPDDFKLETASSMGMNIVKNLVKHQLRGSIEYTEDNWITFELEFPTKPVS